VAVLLPDSVSEAFCRRFSAPASSKRQRWTGEQADAASTHSYATAERDLWFPTISAMGVAGLTPVGAEQLEVKPLHAREPMMNMCGICRTRSLGVRTAWLSANSDYQVLAVAAPASRKRYRRSRSRAVALQGGPELHYRTQPGPAESHAVPTRVGTAKYDYQTQLSVLSYQIGALH
jgi:hypothetical protein